MVEASPPDDGSPLREALWRIFRRRQPPIPFVDGAGFPWEDSDFSRRMLAQHLEQSHGAASRPKREVALQTAAMWEWLGLAPGARLLDVGCGPGLYACDLARRGAEVFGLDVSPAALAHAETHFSSCQRSLMADYRHLPIAPGSMDAAIFLYGQFATMPPDEALDVLSELASVLRPGGLLLLELLDPERVDRSDSNWWFTDSGGLWGDFPYLHLGERHWDEAQQASLERYYILNLETGELHEYALADQVYTPDDIRRMARAVGMEVERVLPAWDGLPLSDAEEWIVYILRNRIANGETFTAENSG